MLEGCQVLKCRPGHSCVWRHPGWQRAGGLRASASSHGVTSSGSTGYEGALATQKDKPFSVFLCYQEC